MKVLLVFAHPEPKSLSASLRDVAVHELEAAGHEVRVSDLYTMNWKSEVDWADFPALASGDRLQPAAASKNAFTTDTLTQDVKAEMDKLLWADTLILQFPLWWFTMPAILKGWVDRVYAYGFAYGVGEHSDTRWGDRYGEGTLAGKRAMLIVTAGGWQEHYGPRGVNGPIDELLFPINHGILYYPGYDVLPPFVAYGTDRYNTATMKNASKLRHSTCASGCERWKRRCPSPIGVRTAATITFQRWSWAKVSKHRAYLVSRCICAGLPID